MAAEKSQIYTDRELAAFCQRMSMLLDAGVRLDDGLYSMAKDAQSDSEKKLLQDLSDDIENGARFYEALDHTGKFPPYVVWMAELGDGTGKMKQIMDSLADYYEKEYAMMQNVKNALTYPLIMMTMLLLVLVILFSKIMPIFTDVFAQLGIEMSPAVKLGTAIGTDLCYALLAVEAAGIVIALIVFLAEKTGHKLNAAEKVKNAILNRSKIALNIARRRYTYVMAMALESALDLTKGLELARDLSANENIAGRIQNVISAMEFHEAEDGEAPALRYDVTGADGGMDVYGLMEKNGLFTSFHMQSIAVGRQSGKMAEVMKDISDDYEQLADTAINGMIAKIEPTMIGVLAVVVGGVLMTVMFPLAGVIAGIG